MAIDSKLTTALKNQGTVLLEATDSVTESETNHLMVGASQWSSTPSFSSFSATADSVFTSSIDRTVLVQFHTGSTAAAQAQVLTSVQGQTLEVIRAAETNSSGDSLVLVKIGDNLSVQDALKIISSHESVRFAEPNGVVTILPQPEQTVSPQPEGSTQPDTSIQEPQTEIGAQSSDSEQSPDSVLHISVTQAQDLIGVQEDSRQASSALMASESLTVAESWETSAVFGIDADVSGSDDSQADQANTVQAVSDEDSLVSIMAISNDPGYTQGSLWKCTAIKQRRSTNLVARRAKPGQPDLWAQPKQ